MRGVNLFHSFLTSTPDRDERLDLRPNQFIPEESVHCAHCLGGWVGLSVSLEILEIRTPDCSAYMLVIIPSALPFHLGLYNLLIFKNNKTSSNGVQYK